MHIDRLYTAAGVDVFAKAAFRIHVADDGHEYIVPRQWGGAAVEVLLARAFCKQPVPAAPQRQRDAAVPDFLWPAAAPARDAEMTAERDIRQVLHRIAGALAYHAAREGLFDAPADAEAFYDELRHLLLHQMAAFETALWSFGFDWAYGIAPVQCLPAERIAALPQDFAPRTLPLSAVTVAADDPRGDILQRIRLLAGIDALDRQEDETAAPLSVMLPVEHVDSPAFINDRNQQDIDAAARLLGRKLLKTSMHHVMDAVDRSGVLGFDADYNHRLNAALVEARAGGAPEGALQRAIGLARQGYESAQLGPAEEDMPPAPFIAPVLSVPDDFIETALTGHGFMMVDGGKASYHAPAPELLARISDAVWSSGAPEIFFRDTAAATSALAERTANITIGRSAAGGFVFLPGTEAPGATINLAAFAVTTPQVNASARIVDIPAMTQAVTIITVALESFISAAGYLSPMTRQYRPLSLGVGGLATVLMGAGLAYDSASGRATAALLTAALSGAAHLASAQLTDNAGAFDGYAAFAQPYLQTVKARIAALGGKDLALPGMTRRPPPLNAALCPDKTLAAEAGKLWEKAYAVGKEQGFRHAHLTAMAASVEVQALLGAQTRDLWPENALVRFEGYVDDNNAAALYGKKMNPAVPRALQRLGYSAIEIDDIHSYAVGHGTLLDAPGINHGVLRAKGFSDDALRRLDAALQGAQHLRYVFNEWTLGEGADSLEALGFGDDEIDDASLYACGAMTLEGAPHLRPEHLAVFDCQRASAPGAVRFVSAEAQLRLQAAVEPFLSGGAGHLLALDHHAGIDDVQKLILTGWELGLKGLKLYREASSLQHPLAVTEAPAAVQNDQQLAVYRDKSVLKTAKALK